MVINIIYANQKKKGGGGWWGGGCGVGVGVSSQY